MIQHEEKISLTSIDTNNNRFQITTKTDINELVCSIRDLGLINYPVIKEQGASFIIISGFRRIAACLRLGFSDVPVRIIDSKVDKIEIARIAITENSLQRSLNLVEQSRCYVILSEYYNDDKSMALAASSLCLQDNISLINKIKKISLLPDFIKQSILTDTISLSMAIELGELEQNTAIEFAELFVHLGLSLNKQREIIEFVKEIAIIEDISIYKVLFSDDLRNILNNDDLNKTQKTQLIRFYLKNRRYPLITKAQKKYEQLIKDLKLGRGMQLVTSKNFENTSHIISLTFNNMAELDKLKKKLNSISKSPIFKKICNRSTI